MITSWKSTLAGLISGVVGLLVLTLNLDQNLATIIMSISVAVLGVVAKDN